MPKSNKIRTRIAPSPTGFFHLGLARSALFNFLFARKSRGKFILRIEDTDLQRSSKKYEKDIIDGLKWLGIDYDEGPDKKGESGPYRQSERILSYEKYLKKLLARGEAYYCFCSIQDLEKEKGAAAGRGVAPVYSGKCRKLTKEQIAKYQKQNKPSIIRFKTPDKEIVFDDLIRGRVSFDTKLLGDFSIAKDLKTPLYNFAAAIDDYEMKISHVIRGEDHLSNTPKQILIQEALNLPHPIYAHLPLILNPDRTKLSKRKNKVSLNEYRADGYLAPALVNYMAFLGWNPKTEQEIFSLEELIKEFSLEQVGKSGAVFNLEKLDWINGYYLRQLSLEKLLKVSLPFFKKAGFPTADKKFIKEVLATIRERMKKLSEIGELADFYFAKKLKYAPKILIPKKGDKLKTKKVLELAYETIDSLKPEDFKVDYLKEVFDKLCEDKNMARGEILWPLRVALSSKEASPGVFEITEILGKEEVLARIKAALAKL